jgi:putative redox protein
MAREHLVKSDYGEAAGGDNQAPNPIELLLAAVVACIEAAFYEFAVHEGFMINALTVDAEGTLDRGGRFMMDDVSAGLKDIRYTFTIESPDDETRIRELAEKVIAHCPVVDSLIKPTQVSGRITVGKR